MSTVRRILHLDLDAFFCAVEEQHNPGLIGKPFAVGGRPEQRGVVSSCSYAARQFGVHSAMPMARALRLCSDLIVVPSRHGVYSRVSKDVMARLRQVTPLVEQISIDEAFLDISGLAEPPEAIARRLQSAIRSELGLPSSIGVAANKLVAKIATEVGKAANRGPQPPNALTIVAPGTEAQFLDPLPVEMLWGVGPKTAERLAELGIQTIGDLARCPRADLERRFGKHGADMALRARGVDDRPIVTERAAKSYSQENTFAQDVREESVLRRTLREQANELARRLQRKSLTAITVKIKLRWPDFTTFTRQTTLDEPVDGSAEILAAAERLFVENWPAGQPVRLLGLGVSGLDERPRQLSLWDVESEKERRLRTALLALRQRFGEGVIQRGQLPDDEDE